MYLSDIASETYYSSARAARNRGSRGGDSISGDPLGAARRLSHSYHRTSPPAPPTSIPLDDSFDAYTTEVPTEWAVGDRHADYDRDESVSGYRNYVTEMERMLSGQMDNVAAGAGAGAQEREHTYRTHQQQQDSRTGMHRRTDTSVSESLRGSSRHGNGRGQSEARAGRRSLESTQPSSPSSPPTSPPLAMPQPSTRAALPPPENARQVTGKRGQVELVEQRILEDSPTRTISLWRERVAQSSAGGSAFDEDARSEAADSHAHARGLGLGLGRSHRRVPSGSVASASDARLRRVVSEQARYTPSMEGSGTRNGSVRGTDHGGKPGRASYERSEYMISYQQATKGGMPKMLFSPKSDASPLPRDLNTPSSPTLSKMYDQSPPSPKLRRHFPRRSMDRSEFMVTYPQTPPHTGSQASSASPIPKGNGTTPRSPIRNSYREDGGGSSLRATSTSSVEVILSSCDPSLLHIAPVLYELGIKRVDHLRAVARLSEETRDREVKEQALKRGVTVVEWAIFLDKLQSL